MDLSLLRSLPAITCAPGDVLITEGRPVDGLFFLESGEVEVLKAGEVIAEVYEPGAVFGDMSYLLGTSPTATVKALTAATFRQVEDPAMFFQLHPGFALHLAVILARRLDSLNRYLVDIKHQFRDRSDHLGMIDEVLDSLMHKHPRDIPRREAGD
ncbi:Cyclic nucleotide-binding domain protein [Lacunisphaera limnophila]|uniref:Cyclic nucleotide-binding domain protein n=1 Tax=Lacunisphaera limnophila TaxID=1838286 RepID=A0A1I7PHQ8_9BACT|nr:cyclic nucleotide-binding domain-containing protein [Lacunisphaera limnophila]AOS43149.1 Cyclic nucleotide-binding domain protein [Lacunisphaera limnophila]